MKETLAAWLPIAFCAGLAAIPAALASWSPWQIVWLVGVLGSVGAIVGGVWAWYAVQVRQAELAPLASDDQAARLLGEALAKHGTDIQAAHTKELWEAYAALPGESKRALALAAIGLLSEGDEFASGLGEKLVTLAKGFRPAGAATATPLLGSDEEAARVLGESVGRFAGLLDEGLSHEIWATFAALSGEPKRVMAAAVAGFFATANNTSVETGGDALRDLVRSFRLGKTLDELLTPEFPTAATP